MQITVDVVEVAHLTRRQFVGSGRFDGNDFGEGYDFNFCLTMPGQSFYVAVDGKAYVVNAADIIQAVIAEHIKMKTEEER